MHGPPLTDLVQIRRLGEQKRSENLRFRSYLKSRDHSDRRLRRIAERIEDEIDCRRCANCCKVAATPVTAKDVVRLSKSLGLEEARFRASYTVVDEDGDLILRRGPDGCVFLHGGECSVYDDRPHNCRDFPHLVRGEGSLVSRMWEFADRASYCPIVFNCMEAFKDESGFRRR